MAYKRKQTDGTEVVTVYNNVLITSFPHSMKEGDEVEFEFGIAIQRDKDGHFYREWVITT